MYGPKIQGPLGCHLDEMLCPYPYFYSGPSNVLSCLLNLRDQIREFEDERRLLIKFSHTGRVVVAVQRCLETALELLDLQDSEESFLWRKQFQHERDEWVECIKGLLSSRWKMMFEMGGKRRSLEIATRLRYGIERYGDVLAPEELALTSDVLDAVVQRSNIQPLELPRWFATSKRDWTLARIIEARGTADDISSYLDLWVDLNHPHVRKCFGGCHVGKNAFFVRERNYRVEKLHRYLRQEDDDRVVRVDTELQRWRLLLGCARGLEYLHGCGLVHRNLTCQDLLASTDWRGMLSGMGLVRQRKCLSSSTIKSLFLGKNKRLPSPERDILAFGHCIFELLSRESSRMLRLTNMAKKLVQPSNRLPAQRPPFIGEEKWDLLSLMCSANAANRIGIRDVIYRLELIVAHEKKGMTSIRKRVFDKRMIVVDNPNLFMVSTLGLTLESTLSEVEQVCDEFPDFSTVNLPVLFRLKDIFAQLQAAVTSLPLDIVERFSLLLVRFLDSLDGRGFGGGSLVASVCASRTIANKNYSIHHDLDRLIQSTPHLQSDSNIHDWLPHFQETQNLQQSTLQGYLDNPLSTLNELENEEDQTEAAALLAFEARNHTNEFAALRSPHLSISVLPKWFIPAHQVELGCHIADGSFGSVYKGKWLGIDVAVKLVMTDQQNAENRRQFLREVDLWFSLSDRNLIRLYGACHVGQPFFVCERAVGGRMVRFPKTQKQKARRWRYIRDATEGLLYLHEHGIIHGDLKGNNILTVNERAKLCDFGLASLVSSDTKRLTKTEIDALGAIQWKAPECLLGSGSTFASDIYSFGMCIIEILTGEYPWGTMMPDSVVKLKVTEEKVLPPRPDCISQNEWSLITRMCCFDPEQRIKIGTVEKVACKMLGQFPGLAPQCIILR